jgi:DNA polymerase III delta prime subunit
MLDLIGNEKAQAFLQSQKLKLPLGKTWLFQGPKGVGKKEFAKHFALTQLNHTHPFSNSQTHPDLHLFKPLGTMAQYTVESMRYLQKILHLPPTLAPFKIIIISHAHLMSNLVANFLLKTLEEPPKDTLIILISSGVLIPTVRSRCVSLFFSKVEEFAIVQYLMENEQLDSRIAKKIAQKANGSLLRAKRYLQDNTLSVHEHLLHTLDQLEHLDFETLRKGVSEFQNGLEDQVGQFQKKLLEQFNLQKERYLPAMQEIEMKKIEGEAALYFKDLLEESFELIMDYYRKHECILKIDAALIKTTQKLHFNFKLSSLLEGLFLSLQKIV